MVKIFIATHKPLPTIISDLYVPIQVNSDTHGLIYDNILTDNTKDNIAHKNENFCELTACYWITKNVSDADIVGLCHYRRYFNLYKNPLSISPSSQKRITENRVKTSKLGTTSDAEQTKRIEKILQQYDVILPYRSISKKDGKKISLTENYALNHRAEDFEITKQIILEKYPEYKNSIHKYLDTESNFHAANMLITKKQIWDDYHNWLFDILFELEQRITIPTDNYQKRIFGFISERLLKLYFYHNSYKIKELPLYKIT